MPQLKYNALIGFFPEMGARISEIAKAEHKSFTACVRDLVGEALEHRDRIAADQVAWEQMQRDRG